MNDSEGNSQSSTEFGVYPFGEKVLRFDLKFLRGVLRSQRQDIGKVSIRNIPGDDASSQFDCEGHQFYSMEIKYTFTKCAQ